MHIVASWESASSVLSSVALVAVALYMLALFALPYFGKRETESHVETNTCLVVEEKPVAEKVVEDAISTDGGETSEDEITEGETTECETSESESDDEPNSPVDNTSMWVATTFAPIETEETIEIEEKTVVLTWMNDFDRVATEVEIVKMVFEEPEEPTYSANFLLACRPRAPPGLKPTNALSYRTEARPAADPCLSDRFSGLAESPTEKKGVFNSYHRKQERLAQKQQQGKAEARAQEPAVRRPNARPAAPWKKQTASAEWTC